MKILCDVCESDKALVFCTADEAALCKSCDYGVHRVNELASKHPRFSLLQPSPMQLPFCDICLERRAFLFCQQDRAILCRECDAPIHSANEHTQKHDRFLLTGMRVSAAAMLSSLPPSAANAVAHTPDPLPQQPMSQPSVKSSLSGTPRAERPPMSANTVGSTVIDITTNKAAGNAIDETAVADGTGSSIAEYLIETLPGWHVEDFLDLSAAPSGFNSKMNDGSLDSIVESNLGSSAKQSFEDWVPQAPGCDYLINMGGQIAFNFTKETPNIRATVPIFGDDVFAVPQITSASDATSRKRSRLLW